MPSDDPKPQDATRLLRRLSLGDRGAHEDLLPLIYDELYRIADRLMSQQRGAHTLQPTALIHEAYLKLIRVDGQEWNGRSHFLRVAARAMRTVLIDHARARGAQRRGGGQQPITLHPDHAWEAEDSQQVLMVDEGLGALAAVDQQLADLVELRFFGGLSNTEISDALGMSMRSVERGWQFARAWLQQHFVDRGGAR